MKTTELTTISKDGFRGFFHRSKRPSEKCLLILMGDEGNDILDRSCAKWLTKFHDCHALCIGVRQDPEEDTGLHSWPLEYIESAVSWLKEKGIRKTGILGISMQASLALTAASRISDLSLVIALAPNDFVPWGFYQGKLQNYAHAEWPSGTSAFSIRGKDLPWQPACLEKQEYWNLFLSEKKKYREIHTRSIFDHSEAASPVKPEAFIPIENIKGHLILAGAKDDVMWNTAAYISRMEKRLAGTGFPYPFTPLVYPYGTHFLFPEKMVKEAVPVLGDLVSCMFRSGRKHKKECRSARTDLENRLAEAIRNW